AGGSALLMLRLLDLVYPPATLRPLVLTVDPYGSRPYAGGPHEYDARHYRAMKRALAGYANHVHYMMDSELFLRQLDQLYVWQGGFRLAFDNLSLVYLDGSHDPTLVWAEIERLLPRIIAGGFLIIDDTDWFDGAVRQRLDRAAPRWPVTLRHHGKQTIISVNADSAQPSSLFLLHGSEAPPMSAQTTAADPRTEIEAGNRRFMEAFGRGDAAGVARL
ncbi:MAG: hypothetical protein ACREA0_24170, partial [bacterium]